MLVNAIEMGANVTIAMILDGGVRDKGIHVLLYCLFFEKYPLIQSIHYV